MTPTELHELVKSVEAPDAVSSLSNGFYTLTVDEMLALCHKVQAQALRDASDWFMKGHNQWIASAAELRRLADELERKA